MKSSRILTAIAVLLSFTVNAQIKYVKTESVKILGNCDMCERTIEKAGNLKNVAEVDWNKDTKIATINYNSKETNQDEILKRIALAGYDSESYLAPDDAYAKLPECCQYERELKSNGSSKEATMNTGQEQHDHREMAQSTSSTPQSVPQLQQVFESYFAVKDALVKSDATTASAKGAQLEAAIKAVDMYKLSEEEHTIWMNVVKDLETNAAQISTAKDVSNQRKFFSSLSAHLYELIKVSKPVEPVYYQHCPMYDKGKGGNWLSKESEIKNPFYGSQMLTCGSTVDTLD